MSYLIVMNFISWMIAFWMLLGFGFIKGCEKDLKNDSPYLSDGMKRVASDIVEEYNSRIWAGRVMYVIWLGVKMMAMPFKIKGRD